MSRHAIIYGAYVHLVEHSQSSLEELIFQAVSSALEKWGVDLREIDSIVTASSDQLDGRSISVMVTGGPAGGYRKDLINLCSASEHALFYQAMRTLSGRSRLGLAVAWGKPSEAPVAQVDNLSLDPFFLRPVPHERQMAYSLDATAYQARAGVEPSDILAVLEKNRDQAIANPRSILYSQAKSTVRSADVAAGELGYSHPFADGCAVLLVGDDSKLSSSRRGVRISGMGLATESYWMDRERLGRWDALRKAASAAYQQAGIQNPSEALDFAELTDITPCHELIAYEALGLAGEGKAAQLVREGATRQGGALPTNPSGGLAGGNPDFAAGVVRVAEASLQLLGEAGPVSVEGCRRGLAHGAIGVTAQSHSVFILEAVDA